MTEVFTSLGADVCSMNDAAEAANLIQVSKIDGIFLDLGMLKVHGLDIVRRVRKSSWNKTTPIVIVTGCEERQTMQEAFAIGATYFLQKPIDRQNLARLFRTVRGGMLETADDILAFRCIPKLSVTQVHAQSVL